MHLSTEEDKVLRRLLKEALMEGKISVNQARGILNRWEAAR